MRKKGIKSGRHARRWPGAEAPVDVDLSLAEVAEALGMSAQQVQKYEKGTGSIAASRLQHLSQVLGVPVAFFFEGLPVGGTVETAARSAELLSHVNQFVATADGLALAKSFSHVRASKLRHLISLLVQQIASEAA